MEQQFENELSALVSAGREVVSELGSIQSRLEHSEDVMYVQHVEFADRASQLSMYLNAALSLCWASLYLPAFAVLRSALEHHVFDWLLFEADRFVQEYPNVDADMWMQWQEDKPKDVLKWEWSPQKNRVRAIWRGVMVEHSYPLSIYYHYFREYDPLALKPDELETVVVGHPATKEDVERVYRPRKRIWSEGLRWQGLKDNLGLNHLLSEREVGQLEIHYRFLSSFVHPFSKQTVQTMYGHMTPLEAPRYDHYASELILLYICYIGTAELRAFIRMTEHQPVVQLRDRTALVEDLHRIESLIDYFWCPGTSPHYYDRVQEANQRCFDMIEASGHSFPAREELVRPEDLPDDEVRYYRDPLRRLIAMHNSFREEVTGFGWTSPWSRNEKDLRL